jgi:hypothetical protein
MVIIIDLGAPRDPRGRLRGPPAVSGGVRVSSTNLLASSQQQELVGLLQALQRWCLDASISGNLHMFIYFPILHFFRMFFLFLLFSIATIDYRRLGQDFCWWFDVFSVLYPIGVSDSR